MHGFEVNDTDMPSEAVENVVQSRKLRVKVRRYWDKDGLVKARFRFGGPQRVGMGDLTNLEKLVVMTL